MPLHLLIFVQVMTTQLLMSVQRLDVLLAQLVFVQINDHQLTMVMILILIQEKMDSLTMCIQIKGIWAVMSVCGLARQMEDLQHVHQVLLQTELLRLMLQE